PWRYTTQPNPDGTGGVTETTPSVLVRIDEALRSDLRAKLTTTAQRTAFDSYVYLMTEAQCAEWHVPMWAGETSAVFIRVPNAVWSSWNVPPPAQVKTFFAQLYREG
ncbi:MAG TPA: hypothetical protein VNJ01_01715, partial [Bacteriovoracaceae bacterium]|nr:hypothetical protein [Bacteriovoracaceae bacterium]